MFEHKKFLDQIERLVERLPYKSVKIEVELQEQTLVLTKDRQRPIGFSYEEGKNK